MIADICFFLFVTCIVIAVTLVCYHFFMKYATSCAHEVAIQKTILKLKEYKEQVEHIDSFDALSSLVETFEGEIESEGIFKLPLLLCDMSIVETTIYPLQNRVFAIGLIKGYNGSKDKRAVNKLKSVLSFQIENEIKRLYRNDLTY